MLHTIGYTHQGRRRPVVYRASIAEMVVPYGSPERSHYRKNVFDSGEIGLRTDGQFADARLRLSGRDPLFRRGGPGSVRQPAHDRQRDLPARGRCRPLVEAFRRSQRPHRGSSRQKAGDLVDLHHRQLRIRVVLVSASGRPHRVRDEGDRHHQHRRLPSRSAGQVRDRRWRPASSATFISTSSARGWTWKSTGRATRWSSATRSRPPPGRRIRTATRSMSRNGRSRPNARHGATAISPGCATGRSSIRRRGTGSASRPPTSWRPAPRCSRSPIPTVPPGGAAGSSSTRSGLRRSIRRNASRPASSSTNRAATTACRPGPRTIATVENTDIVLWHSFGLHHLPRPEDHPVQPCVVCGFKLLPFGFFDQNPVIDLPRTKNAASCCTSTLRPLLRLNRGCSPRVGAGDRRRSAERSTATSSASPRR